MAHCGEVDARQGAYGDHARVPAQSRADRAKVYPAVPRGQENCYPEGISPADARSDGAVGVHVSHAGQRRGYTLWIRFSPTGQDRRGPRRPASPSTSIEVPRFPPKSLDFHRSPSISTEVPQGRSHGAGLLKRRAPRPRRCSEPTPVDIPSG